MTSFMDWFRPNRPRVRQVTCDDLSNPIYLRDVRCFSRKLQVPRRRFVCFLVDGVRDAEADLIDEHGRLVEVDYEALEDEKVEMWLKDWFKRPERHATPRLRIEARARVLAVANLLRLIFPKETESWGQRSHWCSE